VEHDWFLLAVFAILAVATVSEGARKLRAGDRTFRVEKSNVTSKRIEEYRVPGRWIRRTAPLMIALPVVGTGIGATKGWEAAIALAGLGAIVAHLVSAVVLRVVRECIYAVGE